MRLLLVEDDDRISLALVEALTDQNYAVDLARDGVEGWDYIEACNYDLILLDVMLPKLDGMSLCKRVRNKGYQTPILMLTARDTSTDKVMGLDVGADDYVVKPFDLPELSARIRALLRRGNTPQSPVLEWEKLTLDPNKCEVRYHGKELHLTPKEYALLEFFLRSGNRILSRSIIIDHLWTFEDFPGEDTVKVHLRSLRQKLKTAGAPSHFIETIYGQGYRLNQNL